VTITQIAKDYGMSGSAMNRLLHELGIQFKQSDQWLLYQKYHDKGYTFSETFTIEDVPGLSKVVMQTKWTQKGRVFLYNLLKSNGYLPTIERSHVNE
jgi:anti-repressor protein